MNELRARVGMVFQKPTPFPMSIYDNIAFGIRLYEKLPKAELDDRVEEALRKAALWDEAKDKLRQSGMGLSGGQQQRLCIARTIAQKPEVILLDEPTSALDPISTGKIEELIEQLRDEFTIVIVTHNMQQAARISQFTAFMYLGELVEFGPTDQDVHEPDQEADAGLHHRPLRLTERAASGGLPCRNISSAPTTPSCRICGARISEMGGIAEKMLVDSIAALVRRDTPLAQTVIAADSRLDVLQREVEEHAILTIARRQPLAVDLRETISAIRISGDVERIGDLAKNIAKRALAIGGQFQPQKIVVGVQHMSDLVLGAAQGRARRLCAAGHAQGRSTSGSATAPSTRSTPRCSASSSPT